MDFQTGKLYRITESIPVFKARNEEGGDGSEVAAGIILEVGSVVMFVGEDVCMANDYEEGYQATDYLFLWEQEIFVVCTNRLSVPNISRRFEGPL